MRSTFQAMLYIKKFCLFPAFLPLIEIVPWLITAIGFVAAAAGFSLPKLWLKHKYKIITIVVVSILGVATYYLHPYINKEIRHEGTRLIEQANHPIATKYSNSTPVTSSHTNTFQKLWSAPLEKRALSSPLIDGNLIIYGSYINTVEAISRSDGRRVWSLPQNSYVSTLSKGPKGRIYAGEGLHSTILSALTSINPQTGQVYWQREFLGHLEENYGFSHNEKHLLLSGGPSGIWKITVKDARVLWHQEIGHIDSQPLEFKNVIYVPAQEDDNVKRTTLFALNAKTGEVKWKLPQPGQPWGSPRIDKTGKILLTSTGKGQIGISKPTDKGWAYGVSLDGNVIWQHELPNMPLQPALYIADYDMIIHTTKSGMIVALNANTGAVLWSEDSGDQLLSQSTLISHLDFSMIATTSSEGVFTIRSAKTGKELIRRIVPKDSSSSPVVSGDTIYVMTGFHITAFGELSSLKEAK